jgi:hypothetical protein
MGEVHQNRAVITGTGGTPALAVIIIDFIVIQDGPQILQGLLVLSVNRFDGVGSAGVLTVVGVGVSLGNAADPAHTAAGVDMGILAAGVLIAVFPMDVELIADAIVSMGMRRLFAGAIRAVDMLIITAAGVQNIAAGSAPARVTVPGSLDVDVQIAAAIDLAVHRILGGIA